MKKPLINTPEELLGALKEIFPEYVFQRDKNDMIDLSYHSLLRNFIYFYGKNNDKFTERQLRKFAEVISLAINAGGTQENAFGACFLEHLRQIESLKPLQSFLSSAAKARLRA